MEAVFIEILMFKGRLVERFAPGFSILSSKASMISMIWHTFGAFSANSQKVSRISRLHLLQGWGSPLGDTEWSLSFKKHSGVFQAQWHEFSKRNSGEDYCRK